MAKLGRPKLLLTHGIVSVGASSARSDLSPESTHLELGSTKCFKGCS